MFLRQMAEAFLVRTEPDSSMAKPAHIHMTSAPQMRNDRVLRMNWDSSSIAACAVVASSKRPHAATNIFAVEVHRTMLRCLHVPVLCLPVFMIALQCRVVSRRSDSPRARSGGDRKSGGSVWESNPPPKLLAPVTGFEVQAAHQHRYASTPCFGRFLIGRPC
jgi:hypothetical protein